MKNTRIHLIRSPVLRWTIASGLLLALALLVAPLQAGQTKGNGKATASQWIHPAVPGFGGVHPRPNLPVRPDPTENYKIFVDVVGAERDLAGRFTSLQRLARLVNLMAYTKVPSSHVHIVVVLDETVGTAALTNAYYRKMFKADNPNLDLIHALKKAGVEMLVCSQALAGNQIPDGAVDPDVTITLSALTDMVVYGHKGYSFMRL